MKNTVNLAVLCLGTAMALTSAAAAQQSQQFNGQQMGQQPFGAQQQYGSQQFGQQMTGQQQQLSEQRVRSFFQQAENVLQQTARSQDPGQLQQYVDRYLDEDATITSASDLYLGDDHVATTIAKISDETAVKALGHAASALHGRSFVSNYEINIRVRDIKMLPGQMAAKVTTSIRERGTFGEASPRVAQAGQQQLGGSQQQWGQQGQQFGQLGQQGQQNWPQQGQQGLSGGQSGQFQQGGSGMGFGQGRGGGVQQSGVNFQTRATCTHLLTLEQGQIRIGDTFCRGAMRLG